MNDLMDTLREAIIQYQQGLKAVMEALPVEDFQNVIVCLREGYLQGKQLFIIGNGGSAATASHMACDLAKTVLGKSIDRQIKRFKVIALTDNVPLLTAWGNDVSYDAVFAEQLRNLANSGDLLFVITGSGNSRNIIEALHVAKELGLETLGFLGFDGGLSKKMIDHSVVIASDNYGYVEDMHMILTHLITAYFKKALMNPVPFPKVVPSASFLYPSLVAPDSEVLLEG